MVLYAVVLVLVLQDWYCFVKKNDLVTLVVIMILKDTATFQVPFIVSRFCAWNIATVEINSGVHLLKIKSAKCLCLLPVVMVLILRIWSCLHHWKTVQIAYKIDHCELKYKWSIGHFSQSVIQT